MMEHSKSSNGKILLVTDAAPPQINGVVTTLAKMKEVNPNIHSLTWESFPRRWKTPYPDLTFAFPRKWEVETHLTRPIASGLLHIATEGPIGLAFRRWANRPFTTSIHTNFPTYMKEYYGIPPSLSIRYLRWFHSGSSAILVPTPSMLNEVHEKWGLPLEKLHVWSRGFDAKYFHSKNWRGKNPQLINGLYVGRVSKEKNLEAIMKIQDLNLTVIGDGPMREEYQKRYPWVNFLGAVRDKDILNNYYNLANVFLFPSFSDTFGVVLLEAMATGLPVVAYNTQDQRM
jgi:glycosyltransferase involved in cell wall biosynthesis